MRIAGIDPGITGAATLLAGGGRSNLPSLHCVDLPTREFGERRIIDGRAYQRILMEWAPDFIYFENVHSFVGQGIVAAGVFMQNVGILHGISECAVEKDHLILVPPTKWKKRFGLLHTDKNDARKMVVGLFPLAAHFFERVKDHNRADSALIAIYGAERCDMLDLVSR
jgi:hypothetical protein